MTAHDADPWAGEILDITAPLSQGMPVWPGDPPVRFDAWGHGPDSGAPRVTRVSFGSHTGAHVDAPAHVFSEGATMDQLPLAAMVGTCLVAETDAWSAITASDLDALGVPPECSRLLLRTRASREDQDKISSAGSAGLTTSAADWLVARGLALVGIDCASIEASVEAADAPDYGLPVHRVLLAAGIVVVEGLSLRKVIPGEYFLVCLPLKLEGLDGAPVRAILIRSTSGIPDAPRSASDPGPTPSLLDGGKHVD